MSIPSRFVVFSSAALLVVAGLSSMSARQSDVPPIAIRAGEIVTGTVHRAGDEIYRLAFEGSGTATVEVSGLPAECAVQVGSKGFQASETSPVDWTDGQPGQAVKHSFRVEAGRPGTIWVQLRTRASGASGSNWTATACSQTGAYYVTADRGQAPGPAPSSYENRPVLPPLTFRLVARVGGVSGDPRPSLGLGGRPVGTGTNACFEEHRPRIEEFRAHNRAQNPASSGVATKTMNVDAACSAAYNACLDEAKARARNCRPGPDGTYTACFTEENRAWIQCALTEIDCSEGALRRKCGLR